jgi:4Fe-4S single cluster domain
MECKFLNHGIAIQYHNFLKPCCAWREDGQWMKDHKLNSVDIVNWHQSKDLVNARAQLAKGKWPKQCVECESIENQNRQDSIRLGGASEYINFVEDDITLEIRPGNVCNFACQTCWTAASSRVTEFYKKAKIVDHHANLEKNDLSNLDFLIPIKHRLKKIVVLGGEPFYDPKCLTFLKWCLDNTEAEIMMFTNGSVIDVGLLKQYKKFTLIFSLDAVKKSAEYIRFGTIWTDVENNFNLARQLDNVDVRVNITTSIYNFYYLPDVIDMLLPSWPSVVTFGSAWGEIYSEKIIPMSLRRSIIDRLKVCLDKLHQADIEAGQKANAINAVNSIIHNLKTIAYDALAHENFKIFVSKMDAVKKVKLQDYCPEISDILN